MELLRPQDLVPQSRSACCRRDTHKIWTKYLEGFVELLLLFALCSMKELAALLFVVETLNRCAFVVLTKNDNKARLNYGVVV